MIPKFRRSLRRVTLLTALTSLCAGVLLAVQPAAAGVVHRPLHTTAAVGDAPVDAGFPIEYFGLAAQLAPGAEPPAAIGTAPFGEVRFRTGDRWTAWQALGEDGAQGEGLFTAALVRVPRADAYQVRGLPAVFASSRATAFNLDDGPVESTRTTPGAAAGAAAACASRADWGADESITAWSKGTDTPAFAPDQVLTVHHTAGSNDPTQNYAATVRAIEQYHVLTNGWSDIGYQYLIDPNGVVYEGRSTGHASTSCANGGGDGSDFAHRAGDDAVVTGAHAAGYNTGNLGIAMIGCFDSQSSTCNPGAYGSNDTTPTPAATAALRQLLARLSVRHGLNPTGTVTYSNGTNTKAGVPTITGHRDWEATACPGGNVYAQLPSLRTQVAADLTPTGVQATATDTTVHLTWSPGAAWPAAPRATRYRVARDGGPSATTSSLAFDDAGLTPGTTYRYVLTAIAADGSPASPSVATTVTTSGTAPAPAADFSIAVDPASASSTAGTSTSATVSTTAVGGPSDLTLAASVQPATAAVTATLGSSTIAAGSSTSLQVSATAAAPSGTYTVTVTGRSATATHAATFTLSVSNRAPAAKITAASCSGGTCSFSGAGTDPDGGHAALRWTFPGGNPASAGDVTSATTTYASAGTSTVTLQATDPAALTGSATATVSCSWVGKGKAKTLGCTARPA